MPWYLPYTIPAAAASRHGTPFKLAQCVFTHRAGCDFADTFEDINKREVFPVLESGEHRASGEENSRDIGAGSCHQHTGHNLIAGANADETVEPVCLCHQFDRIGNILPRGQGIPHPLMAHCNAVTDTDDAEFEWHSTGSSDTFTDFLRKLSQVNVSRYDGIECVCYTDERQLHLMVGNSQRTQERPVRCTLVSCFYFITAHVNIPELFLDLYSPSHGFIFRIKKDTKSARVSTL